jgi:serine/threonine protein kinase
MTMDDRTQEIRELLFRLADLSDEQRQQQLDQERQSQPEVAAAVAQLLPAVDALLERLPSDLDACRAFLDQERAHTPLVVEAVEQILHPLGEQATVLEALPPLQEEELLPQFSPENPVGLFGDYEVLRELGRGGMGMVYEARQVSLQRSVALKMMKWQSPSEIQVAYFRREAEAAAQLDHPNIVPIYEIGAHQGQHYFSMKLITGPIQGPSLNKAGKRFQGQPREAARLMATVARAVHHAHQRGVLHRDLKPGNILLDKDGKPYVADFGLAKRTDLLGETPTASDGMPSEPPNPLRTNPGAIVGTPSYMAPEQAAGEKQLTTAADLYALGATLYELLTSRPPFEKKGAAETPENFLRRVQTEEPPKPRSLDPYLAPELEAICLKCLRKEPDQRYASAEVLATDLEKFLDGQETSVLRWSGWQRTKDRARRHWAAFTVSLLVFSSVLLAVLLLIVRLQNEARELQNEAREAANKSALETKKRELETERATRAEDRAESLRRLRFAELLAAARGAAERGDWLAALQSYAVVSKGLPADDPVRLSLEVEALPGWFLHRSRQQVAAELNRLDRATKLEARDRATVRLLRADLDLCLNGRTSGSLDTLRQLLAQGKLSGSDLLYAEALAAPTSRAALEKLRILLRDHRSHYRGRVALLGLLLARGQLEELDTELRLYTERFPDDPAPVLFRAWLDILQHDDEKAALARVDAARDRLGGTRVTKLQTFLKAWVSLLREMDSTTNPSGLSLTAVSRLLVLAGTDKEVFALNAPTVGWLWESWGTALTTSIVAQLNPQAALKQLQSLCEDSPEAIFLYDQAKAEYTLAALAEKDKTKQKQAEAWQRAARARNLFYQAADAPTMLPRTTVRYEALLWAISLDALPSPRPEDIADPQRDRRLHKALRRAVSDGRAHPKFRAALLPKVAVNLPPELRRTLLNEWIQEEPNNPIPYRLRGDLELTTKNYSAAYALVRQWEGDQRHSPDTRLDEIRKKAEEGLANLFRSVRPPTK